MEHLESPSVKEWANQVKNDHAELADVFRNSGIEQSGSTTSNYNLSMGPYDKLYQICERTSNDQLDQLDSMIGDHSGDEIDMAFLGTHLVTYRALLSELQSTQQSLSENEFKVNLNDVIAKVENLLEQTEQVYKEVRDQKTS